MAKPRPYICYGTEYPTSSSRYIWNSVLTLMLNVQIDFKLTRRRMHRVYIFCIMYTFPNSKQFVSMTITEIFSDHTILQISFTVVFSAPVINKTKYCWLWKSRHIRLIKQYLQCSILPRNNGNTCRVVKAQQKTRSLSSDISSQT